MEYFNKKERLINQSIAIMQHIYVAQDNDGDLIGAALDRPSINKTIDEFYKSYYVVKIKDVRDSGIDSVITLRDKQDFTNEYEVTIHIFTQNDSRTI